jgi:hypothetical protein
VFEFSVPNNEPAVVGLTHDGSSNFIVHSYTANNESVDSLVNEIGAYQGTRPMNFFEGDGVGLLEVQADGNWTITARPLEGEEHLVGSASGTGDAVVVVEISSPSLDVTHNGESNFIVRAYTTDSTDGLTNEIGEYSGTVRSPTGTVIFDIRADGDWTLAES